MKKTNNMCLLVVATSGIATVATSTYAQDRVYGREPTPTTASRIQDRFAPYGMHLGGLVLDGSLGAGATYVSNAKYTATGADSDTIVNITPTVSLRSDWGRHAFRVGARVNTNKYSNYEKESTTDWDLFARGQVDITGRSRILVDGGVSRGTEGRDSNLSLATLLRPTRTNYRTANIAYQSEFNRLRFRVGAGTRTEKYNHTALTTGAVSNQHFRDVEYTNINGRVDYALSPDTSIYLYGASEKRAFDISTQADSDNRTFAIGASFDLSQLITGEVEIGGMTQDYKNLNSKENNSYYRANVVWMPTTLTTVTGRLGRANTDALAFSNFGALTTSASVTVDHELLRNLLLTAEASHVKDDFRGGFTREDTRDAFGAKATYFLSNRVSVNTEIKHETLDTTGTGAKTYKNNIFRVGLALNY